MKKFLKTLVVGLCLFTLLCCALPAAFAADKTSGSKKEENVYAIGMDAQGGICSTVVTYTNLSGKLESTPEQPTMTGYTFDGWYTEKSGGTKITTDTVFSANTTVYAHWTYIGGGGGYNPRPLDCQGRYLYCAAAHHPACHWTVAKVCRACTCGRCPAYYSAGRHHVLNTAVNAMIPLKKGILP